MPWPPLIFAAVGVGLADYLPPLVIGIFYTITIAVGKL